MSLKDDIKLIREHVAKGDVISLLQDHRRHLCDTYKVLERICDAAEKTLPKTVIKYHVEGTDDQGVYRDSKHFVPFIARSSAGEFAANLISRGIETWRMVKVTEHEHEVK